MKAERITLWIAVALAAILFAPIGLAKFMADESLVRSMALLHYSETFTRLLGLAEILGAIGLIVANTRIPAALGLMMIMAGAVGSHIAGGHPLQDATAATIAWLVLATIAVLERDLRRREAVVAEPIAEHRLAAAA